MKLTCTKSGLGLQAGDQFPVLSENKLCWIIVIGQMEKKVTKSTGFFAGAPKGGPSFELVTVTENVGPSEPKRRRGRPVTGNAQSPAAKQAAYRARLRQKAVTVTLSRELVDYLDAQMVALRDGGSSLILSPEQAAAIHDAIRRASLVQLPPADGELREP